MNQLHNVAVTTRTLVSQIYLLAATNNLNPYLATGALVTAVKAKFEL